MSEHIENAPLQFARIRPDAPDSDLVKRAGQILTFKADTEDYYRHVLGLERISPDPPPNPDNADEIAKVVHMIKGEGVSRERYSFVGAFALGASEVDDISDNTDRDNGLRGLMVLRKPDGHCEGSAHRATEITTWALRTSERRKGLGRQLAIAGYLYTPWLGHPQDSLFTMVPTADTETMASLGRYGFEPSNAEFVKDDTFDTPLQRLEVRNRAFMEAILGDELTHGAVAGN
jgi:hypothetical protein